MSYSVSLSIFGIKPKDAKYDAMCSMVKNCLELEIDVPKEVLEYFNVDDRYEIGINGKGVEQFFKAISYSDYEEKNKFYNDIFEFYSKGNGYNGYIIDLLKLPKDITHLKCELHFG